LVGDLIRSLMGTNSFVCELCLRTLSSPNEPTPTCWSGSKSVRGNLPEALTAPFDLWLNWLLSDSPGVCSLSGGL
jgi:hypothetical protein